MKVRPPRRFRSPRWRVAKEAVREHVKILRMMEADDAAIWSYARDNGFGIASKETVRTPRDCDRL